MAQAEAVKKTYKVPKKLGDAVDRMWELDQQRLKLNAEAKKLEDEYNYIEAKLLEDLPKQKLDGAAGGNATVGIDSKDYPNVKNWDKLRAHIIKTKQWDLLAKQCLATSCRERWNARKVIPGVEIFTKVQLKLTARRVTKTATKKGIKK